MISEREKLEKISDILAGGNFIVFTGSGISSNLKVKGSGKKMPQWHELIERLGEQFKDRFSSNAYEEFQMLLHPTATSEELIEAASILSESDIDPSDFDEAIRDQITPEENQESEVHSAILKLAPRGIVTLNFDTAHEDSIKNKDNWKTIQSPDDEEGILELIRSRFSNQFLLKAHGSISSEKRLILDYSSFRDVLAKQPAYRALILDLLTDFHFIFIGFGMTDPDFESCLKQLGNIYGAPIRDHILITGPIIAPNSGPPGLYAKSQRGRSVFLKRRYGIYTLRVNEYSEIPDELEKILKSTGPEILKLVDGCLSKERSIREQSHRDLVRLNPNGKKQVRNHFSEKIKELIRKESPFDEDEEFKLSELTYSLGKIVEEGEAKNELLKIAKKTLHKEVMAHALVGLSEVVRVGDIPDLKIILDKCNQGGFEDKLSLPDSTNRLTIYAQYLIARAYGHAESTNDLSELG